MPTFPLSVPCSASPKGPHLTGGMLLPSPHFTDLIDIHPIDFGILLSGTVTPVRGTVLLGSGSAAGFGFESRFSLYIPTLLLLCAPLILCAAGVVGDGSSGHTQMLRVSPDLIVNVKSEPATCTGSCGFPLHGSFNM